jgi:adenine-specific DNA-methyltransferase
MATGIPKTNWKSKLSEFTDSSLRNYSKGMELSYEGKLLKKKILNIAPADIQVIYEGVNASNYLYFGDNLPILSHLYNIRSIKGKVRLIYIDPPFSTKNIYQSRSQDNAYCDLLEGAHYVESLRERLVFLRELLAEDGSIYVHLDENMAFHIKIIMDEIFGRVNFRNWITRKKCHPKNYTKKTYGNISDYILFYTKSDKYVWNRPFEKWTAEHANKEYVCIEQETNRKYKKVPIHAPGVRNGETGKAWRGLLPPPGKHWQFIPKKLDELDKKGEIFWSSNGNPRRKVYLDSNKGISVQDIWLKFYDANNQNVKITGYPTEKNPQLLNRIISTSSNVGDIVLDCFSGAGTSLVVASELRRRWIGIDNSHKAIEATILRFLEGCKPMGDYVNKQRGETTVKKTRAHNIIRDFNLCVTGSYQNELDKIVKKMP